MTIDALVFVAAAAMNFGANAMLGGFSAGFEEPIWQAGLGEAVIGLCLLAAAGLDRAWAAWAAFVLSVLGIVFGLTSKRVVGEAHEIHVVLVPLALILLVLLLLTMRRRSIVNTTG